MQPSPSITFDTASNRSPGWQVVQRIQFAVTQVAAACAGLPESEVAQELSRRLRGLGVNPNQREIQRNAQSIAQLPKPT